MLYQNVLIAVFVFFVIHLSSAVWIVISPTLPPYAYDKALYWTLVTMTTTGFGDITAHTTAQAIVALLVMIIGSAL